MDRALNVKIAVVQGLASAESPGPGHVIAANSAGSQSISFSASELEVLMFVIDASLKLQTRPMFFSWAQGILQALLPHELLICTLGDPQSHNASSDCFHSAAMPGDCLDVLCRGETGTVSHLVSAWQAQHRTPLCHGAGADGRIGADLARFKLNNLIAHGTCFASGEMFSFFSLVCLPEPVGPRQAYLLDVLVPYLHAAWLRIHVNRPQAELAPRMQQLDLLTGRELEVMKWVYEGKSNIDIGGVLQISPLTVKNHVQKILRKLDVQNRTQAVARCLALKLLKS